MASERDEDEMPDVGPEDFLRAILKISPEDAAKAREDADQHHSPSARTKKDDPAK